METPGLTETRPPQAERIDPARSARQSEGRLPVVHTVEPACELQVAHGRAGLVLPRPIVQLGTDLETLPVAWAHGSDLVLARTVPTLALRQRWLEAGLAVPEFVLTPLDSPTLPRDHPLRTRALGELRPWGWSPDAVERLAPCMTQLVARPRWQVAPGPENQALRATAAPSEALLHPDRQALFRKDYWPAVHQRWEEGPRGDGSPVAVVARTRRAALGAVAVLHSSDQDAVLKAPLGTAGRAAIRVLRAQRSMAKAQRRWLDRCLGHQGAVVVMPWLDRVADLSVQLRVERDGRTRALGVTRFLTDARGQYLGTILGRMTWGLPPPVREFWRGSGGASPVSVVQTLNAMALHVGQALADAGFAGVAGVDGLVYRSAEGELRLHPLLEVNPRMTLGHAGLALERRMAPGQIGLLLLVGQRELRELRLREPHQRGDVGFAALLARLQAALPLEKTPAGLRSGVVPLGDPAVAQVALPLWLVAPTGGQLREALAACGLALPWAGCWRLAG